MLKQKNISAQTDLFSRIPIQTRGWMAVAAGLVAVLISMPFAVAYFRAYGGSETPPPWFPIITRWLLPILGFASRPVVYAAYGKAYSLVYPLTLPALVSLHQMANQTRWNRIGYRTLVVGVTLAALGIVGDYWPIQDSWWIGAGFFLELVGLLVVWVGSTMYGISLVRGNPHLKHFGKALSLVIPGGLLGIALLAHIPSGPSLGFIAAWIYIGYHFATQKMDENENTAK